MNQSFTRKNSIFEQFARSGFTIADLLPAFPGDSEDLIRQRLIDNSLRYRRTVERFGYLGTRECDSQYFNIAPGRFRRSPNCPRVEPTESGHVHCYGGSTTAGHNVGDEECVPHYLEEALRVRDQSVRVLNYGAGNHTSLHASLSLLDHCLAGRVPKTAVMLHGLNDALYVERGADGVVDFLDQALMLSQHSPGNQTSIGELAGLVPRRLGLEKLPGVTFDSAWVEQMLVVMSNRLGAACAISDFCSSHWGVEVRRFWEPTPFHCCRPEQDYFRKLRDSDDSYRGAERLLREIAARGLNQALGTSGICDISDCGQQSPAGMLFVDEFHGTPMFNRHIATVLANDLTQPLNDIERTRKAPSGFAKSVKPEIKDIGATSGDVLPEHNLYPLW